MGVYVDRLGHMKADTPEELHDFATRIGLKLSWFQDHPRHPHYDLTTKRMIDKAIKTGAKMISPKEMVRVGHD